MLHHYITKYTENGKKYAEAWLQLNVFGFSFCFSKRKKELEGWNTNIYMWFTHQYRLSAIQRIPHYTGIIHVYQLLFMVDIVVSFLCYSRGFGWSQYVKTALNAIQDATGTVSGIRLSVRHWTWKMHAGGLKTQQDLMQADTGNIGEKENEGKCIRHSI